MEIDIKTKIKAAAIGLCVVIAVYIIFEICSASPSESAPVAVEKKVVQNDTKEISSERDPIRYPESNKKSMTFEQVEVKNGKLIVKASPFDPPMTLESKNFRKVIVEKDEWGKSKKWMLFSNGAKVRLTEKFLQEAPKPLLYRLDYARCRNIQSKKESEKSPQEQ